MRCRAEYWPWVKLRFNAISPLFLHENLLKFSDREMWLWRILLTWFVFWRSSILILIKFKTEVSDGKRKQRVIQKWELRWTQQDSFILPLCYLRISQQLSKHEESTVTWKIPMNIFFQPRNILHNTNMTTWGDYLIIRMQNVALYMYTDVVPS